jgi:hypothetical protein
MGNQYNVLQGALADMNWRQLVIPHRAAGGQA